jgi:formate dehydrogenase assembly factor FdhD
VKAAPSYGELAVNMARELGVALAGDVRGEVKYED